jgi:hypothetical protein
VNSTKAPHKWLQRIASSSTILENLQQGLFAVFWDDCEASQQRVPCLTAEALLYLDGIPAILALAMNLIWREDSIPLLTD